MTTNDMWEQMNKRNKEKQTKNETKTQNVTLCVFVFFVHFLPEFVALFQGFFVSIIYCFCNGEVSVG